MKKIKIDIERDILIIEKFKNDTILKGSNVYCGCCGETIGTLKNKLTMPFFPKVFLDSLENKSVNWMLFGLRHDKCNRSMFSFKKAFDFISLDNYQKQISK